jgi:ketosteroid isomerase-like protein
VVHQIATYSTPDGTKHEKERQLKTYVVVKQKDKWLLTHDHNTIIQEPNTAANPK